MSPRTVVIEPGWVERSLLFVTVWCAVMGSCLLVRLVWVYVFPLIDWSGAFSVEAIGALVYLTLSLAWARGITRKVLCA